MMHKHTRSPRPIAILLSAALAFWAVPAVAFGDTDAASPDESAQAPDLSDATMGSEVSLASVAEEDALSPMAAVHAVALKLKGYSDRSDAFNLLAMANIARGNIGDMDIQPLEWNPELAEAAEQRAAELALKYDEKRPNGSEWYTIFPGTAHYDHVAENIARSYSNSVEAFQGWSNDPGQFANMTNSNFSSMGAACFSTARGGKFWVQLFSDAEGVGTAGAIEGEDAVYSVEAYPDDVGFVCERNLSLLIGQTNSLHVYSPNAEVDPSTFYFSSSDPSVARVSADGSVKAFSSGNATITAGYADVARTAFEVEVSVDGKIEKPTAESFPYDGKKHIGVPFGVGYDLMGTNEASKVGTYSVVVNLEEGFTWSDGTQSSLLLMWEIWDPLDFVDVPRDAWYATNDLLGYIVSNKIMNGYGNKRFGPDDTITRGQVACVLYNMAGQPTASMQYFVDVPRDSYYSKAIDWARTTRVINGYRDPDGKHRRFGPDDPVTREQLVAMFANYARYVGDLDVSSSCMIEQTMPDHEYVSDFAYESVGWALDNGIIGGVPINGVNYIEPQSHATRCQAVKMLAVLHRDILHTPVN